MEDRRLLIATAIGSSTTVEGQPYTLNLSQSYDSGINARWQVNWGDGTSQSIAGNARVVSHVYKDGPANPTITTEFYRNDGQFAGFNPAEVSVGSDGTVFGRTAADALYRLDGQTWTQIAGSYRKVSVRSANEVWWLDATGNVGIFNGATHTPVLGRLLKTVSVSSDGTVWGVDTSNVIVTRISGSWVNVSGTLVDVEAMNGGGAVGVNQLGSIYQRSGTTWTQISGTLKDVAVGADGNIIGITAAGQVYQRSNNAWVLKPWLPLRQISSRNVNDVWGVDATGAVVRWDGVSFAKLPVTSPVSITVSNAAPGMTIGSPSTLFVNQPFVPSLSFADNGADTVQYVAVNWGDYSAVEVFPTSQSPSHRYALPGTYSVTVSAFDEDMPLPRASANAVGAVVVEAERFSASEGTGASVWQRIPAGNIMPAMVELAAPPTASLGESTTGARLDFDVNFDRSGTKYAWLRVRSPQGTLASVHLGLNGAAFSLGGQGVLSTSTQWEWVRTVLNGPVGNKLSVNTLAGPATLNLWARDGRLQVDQWVLTPDANFVPSGRQQETRSLASSYPAASTSVTVTPAFQPATLIPQGSLLPVATVDFATIRLGQSIVVPAMANDFDPDGQTLSLVSTEVLVRPTQNSILASGGTSPITATLDDGQVRLSVPKTPETTGDAVVQYVVQDASGNRVAQRIHVNISAPETGTSTASVFGFGRPQESPSSVFNAGYLQESPAAKYVTREDADLSLPSIGIAADITRHYAAKNTENQGFGPGWSFRYGTFLAMNAGGTGFVWTKPNGDTETFTAGATTGGVTQFSNAVGNGTTAQRTVSGATTSIQVTTKHAETYTFVVSGQKGRLQEVRDRNANVQSVSYQASGLIYQVTESHSQISPRVRLTFAGVGDRITSITDDKGRVWNYEYNQVIESRTYLTKVLHPPAVVAGARQSFSYQYSPITGTFGFLIGVTEKTGEATQYGYHLNGRLESLATGGKLLARYRYDDATVRRETTDGTGVVLIEKYDPNKAVLEQYDSEGLQVANVYDSWGRLIQSTATGQSSAFYTYDSKGNLLTQRGVDGVYTKFEYDPMFSQVIRITSDLDISATVTDDDRILSTRVLDTRGNLIEETDVHNKKIIRSYSARGLLVSQTDPRGVDTSTVANDYTTEFIYNADGQLLQRLLPLAITPTTLRPKDVYAYDSFYNLSSHIDATGLMTTFQFDRIGQLLSKSLPAPYSAVPSSPIVTRLEYDNFGRVIAQIDAKGNRTRYEWDAGSRLSRQVNADGSDIRTTYDAVGRPAAVRDESGYTTSYFYDPKGKLRATVFPDGTTRITNGSSSTIEPNGGMTSTELNTKGQKIRSTDAVGAVTQWTYDTRGQLASMTSPLGMITTYNYDHSGRLSETKIGDQRIDKNTYDAAGNVISVTSYDISGLSSYTLTSLPPSRVRVVTTTFDAENRPLRVTSPDPDGAGPLLAPYQATTYDAAGRRISLTDARGFVTQFAYDAAGRLHRTTLPATAAGTAVLVTFLDPNGNVVQSIDAMNRATTIEYDSRNRPTREINPLGQASKVTYDRSGRAIATLDALDRATFQVYDSRGQVVKTVGVDPDGSGQQVAPVWQYRYDAVGKMTESIDPLGRITSNTYDLDGRLTKTLSPLLDHAAGQRRLATTYTYNAADLVLSTVEAVENAVGTVLNSSTAAERTTTYTYTTQGRPLRVTTPDPDGAGVLVAGWTQNTYNGFGDVTSTTDHLSRLTSFVVDNLGRTIQVASPDPDATGPLTAPLTTVAYDAAGNVVGKTDPNGNQWRYSYDAMGRQAQSIAPNAATTSTLFDLAGNPIRTTDPLGRQTDRTFDALGRIMIVNGPAAEAGATRPTWITTYDASGNIASTTLPTESGVAAIQTFNQYDALNRLISVTSPDPDGMGPLAAPVQQFVYDGAGRRVRSIDPLSRVTEFKYDAVDRLTATILPDLDNNSSTPAPKTETIYDDAFKTRTEVDALQRATVYLQDNLGRTIQETRPAATSGVASTSPIVRNAFDNAGKLASITDPLGRITTYTYDDLGRKISQSDPNAGGGAPLSRWTYDASGNVTSETDPLGRLTTRTYDTLNRLSQVTYPQTVAGSASSSATESFTYDAVGNVKTITDGLGRVTTLEYDNLDRLTRRILPDPSLNERYRYDLRNNQIESIDALGRVTRNVFDRLSRPTQVILPAAAGSVTSAGPAAITTYDVVGNVLSTSDLAGRVTSFTYDAWNRQTRITSPDPDGAGPLPAPFIQSAFDDAGNLISSIDQVGRMTLYRYDNLNREIGTTLPDPDGVGPAIAPTTASQYDLVGNRIAIIDTLGRQTNLQYDALNRLVLQTLPDPNVMDSLPGPQTRYTYDLVGNNLSVQDPLNRITTFTYDSRNREVTRRSPDPDGAGPLDAPQTNSVYDKAGNLIVSQDQLGRITGFEYDLFDRQTKVILPDPDGSGPLTAPVSSTVYDAVGNVVASIDPRGNRREWVYDNWNRKLVEKLPNPASPTGALATGPQSSWTYDALGNVITQTDTLGLVTTYSYDALNRLLLTTDPDPDGAGALLAPQTRNTYDAAGNLATVSESLTITTSLTTAHLYDQWDRKIRSTDPRGSVTQWSYDTQDNLKSITDAAGNVTFYTHDVLDRVTQETNPLGIARTFTYDIVGNRIGMIDRMGRKTDYSFDALNRPLDEQWKSAISFLASSSNVRTIATRYNNAGLVASVTDSDSTTTYAYDSLDRLTGTSRTGAALTAHSFAYSYDVASNLTSRTQTVGGDITSTSYAFDSLDRPTSISLSGTALLTTKADYVYRPDGQVASIQRSQGSILGSPLTTSVIRTDFAYDLANRTTGITHKTGVGNATTLAGYSLAYDAASRLNRVGSTLDGDTNFTLDSAGQLTAANRTSGINEAYAYDATGNRTGAGYLVGANNQVLRDDKYAYTYDNEGNRLTRTLLVNGNPSGAKTEYVYDYRQRLTKVTEKNASGVVTASTSYTYDGGDYRLTRAVDTDGDGTINVTQRFVVDRDTVTAMTSGTGAIQNRYLQGAQVDEVLADVGTSGTPTWTLADHQNTVRDLATFNGTLASIANHRVFDSFGKTLSQTHSAVDTLFGYTGRELDSQTGLNYYRARWYDSAVGEFLTPDPIGFAGGDTNLTRYVGNSPNDYTDPTGNSWLSKIFRKVKREVSRVVSQVREVVRDAVDDVREFVDDHPVLAGLAALGTGAWFVAASGGMAGAFSNLGTLASKAVGSISTGFTSASSGIGGTFSLNVGNFASLGAGAGISGTTAFAGLNVSVLGLPVWSLGPTVGVFGNVADSVASTLAGNFSDAVSRNVLAGTSQIDASSFVQGVATQTVKDYAYSQLNQTGLPLVYGVATQTAAFAGDVYGAFDDVFTPQPPVAGRSQTVAPQTQPTEVYDPETGLYRLLPVTDAVYLNPQRSIWKSSAVVRPGVFYTESNAGQSNVYHSGGFGGYRAGKSWFENSWSRVVYAGDDSMIYPPVHVGIDPALFGVATHFGRPMERTVTVRTEAEIETLRSQGMIFNDPRYYTLLVAAATQPGAFETTIILDGADNYLLKRRASAMIDAIPILGNAYNIRTGLVYDEPWRAGFATAGLGLEVLAPAVGFSRGAGIFVDDTYRLASSNGGLRSAPNQAFIIPRSLGAKASIEISSQVKISNFAIKQANSLGQAAQRDVDDLLGKLATGHANAGIGPRALGSGFFELRGHNAGRVIVKQIDDHMYDIVGKFQGHRLGDSANSGVINKLIEDYINSKK